MPGERTSQTTGHSMPKKALWKTVEQEVASAFLLGRRRYDTSEFFMEFGRAGLKFACDKIDPDDQEQFTMAFDDLVELGCLPKTLASTLYCFCKSSSQLGLSFPPLMQAFPFPPNKEIRNYRDTLCSAVRIIQQLDDYCVMEILAKHAKCSDPPPGRKELVRVLRWYIDSLPTWWVPRKDIVQSYAPIACCMYAKIATRKFQFPQATQLLECFGYKSDPKRQKRTKDRSPGGFSPSDKSLERNYRNFKNRYPLFCECLEADLRADHERERNRASEEFDRWDDEGLPVELLDKLRPNNFDWKTVFARPTS